MKLFLLDGYALIYRAFYAFINSPRINSKGQNTSAVLGFVNTLEEILRKQQPSHIGVAFDPHGGTFRHKAFPSYKAQREQTPEAITFAVPIIKQILEAYRIPILEVAGYEADDVIGTLAHQADEQGIETVMITPDKDYGQLVTERVTMLRPPVGKSDWTQMGPHEVCEKWGIENPRQVIDILGLMGDSSDNIPGCPGVGEKTATNLIQQFGGVEGLLQRTDELKGAIQKKVTENEQQIRDSYWLATIALDVPITLDMNLLERKDVNENALRDIYESLEFGFLLKKIKAGSAETGSAPKAKKKATDSAQLDLFDDFNPQDNTAAPAEPMEELVENGEEVIGHDLKSIFRKNGQAWPEKPCFDTMLAHYLLHPEMTHNLSAISQGENLTTLRQRLERELREENLWDLFQTVEMP